MRFAFYTSGHGFGHATRVSALSTELLKAGHGVTVVTNAPPLPFAAILPPSSLAAAPNGISLDLPRYAAYRRRNVDAGIVQPKAYDVDRRATYAVLEGFMQAREQILEEEIGWLKQEGIEAVLSDATFLGWSVEAAAAAGAGIPAIIVSNFTFDSCYSYLSHPALPPTVAGADYPEAPLSPLELDPLVNQSIADYACASLLLRLPGAIPIPAFDTDVCMPAGRWVSDDRTCFVPEVEAILSRPTSAIPSVSNGTKKVVNVPLIVRPPSPSANRPEFRRDLLASMGVPDSLMDSKVLLVSFGGQAIPRPRSRPPSPLSSPLQRPSSILSSSASLEPPKPHSREAGLLPKGWIAIVTGLSGGDNAIRHDLPWGFFASEKDVYVPDLTWVADCVLGKLVNRFFPHSPYCRGQINQDHERARRATARVPRRFPARPPSSTVRLLLFLLPVLPWMLTPSPAVPRPLFVEEFGLKRLMQARGTSLELDRADFEAGRWEFHVEEAYAHGRAAKEEARRTGFVDEKAGEVIRREIETFMEQQKRKGAPGAAGSR
ncbi:SPOSA6832_03426, partial [Sporobolomyces salmonicolor]